METEFLADGAGLSPRQMAWAESHDWFVMDKGNGTALVLDRWVHVDTGVEGECYREFRDFSALRDFAGY